MFNVDCVINVNRDSGQGLGWIHRYALCGWPLFTEAATCFVFPVEPSCLGELCCALGLDAPVLERRTGLLTPSLSSGATLDWSEDIIL